MTKAKTPALQQLIDKLQESGRIVRESESSIVAQCPAHDDSNPSLSLDNRRDGRGAKLHCHAGCDYVSVLNALGLTETDLYDDDGIRDALQPIKTYVYPGGHKNHRGLHPNGKKKFWQEIPEDKSLYAIDTIGDAKIIYLCEGEKAADVLRALGYAAVATGGAQRPCDLSPLQRNDLTIMIIADRDEAGLKWAHRHAKALKPFVLWVGIFQAKVKIPKADIVEHISAGYGVDELEYLPCRDTNGHDIEETTEALLAPIENPPRRLIDIEQGFWESRESLRMIYQTSMAKMCSPWAVLAQCAARALAQVRPCVTLPDIIGGRGSLNWFTAIVAPSGRGKGASGACARLLVPQQILQRNLGTGEGILDAYVKPANKETGEPRGLHESVMLTADEVDTLAALRSRSGSTLMGILRSGFSGETLGFSYRSNSTHLEAHTYRMTMVLSVQPEKADWIIADHAGGTPQRLMWFPATDDRITKQRPWPSGPLELPAPREWQYPREIMIPQEARDLIEDAQVDRNRGKVDALDGHALFCREKFAYALAVLDNRVEMTSEDWELSGIAAEVSSHTREQTVEAIRSAARIEALDRGEVRGLELAAAEESKNLESAERVRAVLRGVLEKLDAAGEVGLSNRELQQKTNARNRRWLQAALQIGSSNGLIAMAENSQRWVKL